MDAAGSAGAPEGRSWSDRARGLQLYHTFELPDGTVVPGFFDLRKVVHRLPIPASLAGKRCLDVASATGFFSVEMARRGAAEVVSVDIEDPTRWDWQGPPGVNDACRWGQGLLREGFDLVREAYGVDIDRRDLSLYELSPAELGTFDFVFMGNILLHLGDPGRGLRAVRSMVGTGGELLSFEPISFPLTVLRPLTPAAQLWPTDEATWWRHNLKGYKRLIEAGGFRIVDSGRPFLVPLGDAHPRWPSTVPRRLREWAYWTFTRQLGTTSTWVRAVPRPLEGDGAG